MDTTAVETYRYTRLRVAHFDVHAPAVMVGRVQYFPVRALCAVLGVAPEMQRKRLQEDSRFRPALRTLPIPTPKGQREALCIRRDMVGAWFASIDPARCKIANTREQLEHFQRELFAAADRFLFPGAAIADGGDHRAPFETSPATAAVEPVVSGVLHVGACPSCGVHLCLVLDSTGAHLTAEPEQDDS